MSPQPPALPPGAVPGAAQYVPSPAGAPPPGFGPPPTPQQSNPGFALAAFGLSLVAAIGFPILYFLIAAFIDRSNAPENFIFVAVGVGLLVAFASIVLSIWALVVARRGEGGRKVLAVVAVIVACASPVTSFFAALLCLIMIGGLGAGRPLRRRDGSPAVAPTTSRDDWCEGATPRLVDLDADQRRALAEAWLAEASLEHASIAAFGRLTLDLLAMGAPPELVTRACAAASEEIAHATAAFSIASAYAGRPLGPAALPEATASLGPSSEAHGERAARMVFEGLVDGFVGEGAAARVAALAALRAEGDEVVASAQRRVAREEASHAQLGWDVAAWLLLAHPREAAGGLLRADVALRRLAQADRERAPSVSLRGRLARHEERAILADEARRAQAQLEQARHCPPAVAA